MPIKSVKAATLSEIGQRTCQSSATFVQKKDGFCSVPKRQSTFSQEGSIGQPPPCRRHLDEMVLLQLGENWSWPTYPLVVAPLSRPTCWAQTRRRTSNRRFVRYTVLAPLRWWPVSRTAAASSGSRWKEDNLEPSIRGGDVQTRSSRSCAISLGSLLLLPRLVCGHVTSEARQLTASP